MGNKVVVGPLGTIEYDPLRHYSAVQYEDTTGIAAVSNGIQTEAIFETYLLTAFVFLVFSLILTGLLRFLERRFRIPGLGISVRAGE